MILVAGGSGMLGVALRKLYGKRGVACRAVSSRGLNNCEPCDLSDEAAVKGLFRTNYDYVIHAAALSDVDACEREPDKAYAANALTTRHLARACAEREMPFVYVSTDYVFDGRKKTPYEVDDPTGPVQVYGMTKLAGESFVDKKANPKSAAVRTSWLFGPGNPRNFVDAIAKKLKSEATVGVLRDQTDSPTYTADLAEALQNVGEALAGRNAKDVPRVLHFCNKGETTRFEMAKKMKEILAADRVSVEVAATIPDRPALRPTYGVLSTRGFEEFFGIKVRLWEEGLREYLKGDGAFCVS